MRSPEAVRWHRSWCRGLVIVVVAVVALAGSLALAGRSSRAAGSTNITSLVPQLVVRAGTSNVLYVLYSATCGEKSCYRLTRSANGGRTFGEVSVPPISDNSSAGLPTGTLDQLVFANAEDGYASENFYGRRSILYATFNGGRSWHLEHVKGAQFIQSLASSPTSFYAITESCDRTHVTCKDYQLARTPLEKSNWRSGPLPENVLKGGSPSFGLELAAYGAKIWLVEQDKNPPQRLATSTNGGRTFSVASEPGLGGAATCELTVMSTTSLWATCAQGNQLSELLYSQDGGVRWNASSSSFRDRAGSLAFGNFDPVSKDVAYATDGVDTNATQIIYQINGYTNTLRVIGSLPTSRYFYFLTFTNARQGLAYAFVGQGATHPLWSTDNGGRSWRPVAVPTT